MKKREFGWVVKTTACIAAILAFCLLVGVDVSAQGFEQGIDEGVEAARGEDMVADLFGPTGAFRTVTNILLFVIGAISVIMLIIGGLRYVVSGGDSTKVQEAKNTILYAIVGVLVALFSYAAIDFVISSFRP